jgi:hypothetical protein
MKRTIILVCIGVVLLMSTLAFGVSHPSMGQAKGIDAIATFTPVSLETTQQMVMAGTASAPDNFIVLCNAAVSHDNVRTDYVDVKLDGTTASLSTISSTEKRYIAHCLTSDGRLLVEDTKDAGSKGKYRQLSRTLALFDPKTSLQTDITPSNLNELLTKPSGEPVIDNTRYLWDARYGLVMFSWDTEGWTLKVWAGKKELEEVGSVPNILANAQLYVNDRFTYGAVTQDGKLFAYDFADGKLKQVDEYTPIAQALVEALKTPGKKLIRTTIAKGVAVYGNSNVLTIVTLGGKPWSKSLVDSLAYRPNGDKRPEEESNALVESKMRDLLREEAAKLPPDYISSLSQQIALDEDSVGMLDILYQRLIVITPK